MEFWQTTPYLILYVAAASIVIFLTIVAWQLKTTRATRAFSLTMLGVAVWLVGYSLQISSTSLEFKLFLIPFQYAGIISATYFWLIFVIYYTQYQQFFKNWIIILSGVVPLITFLEALTLTSHTIFYKSYQLETINGLQLLTKEYGIGFYIWAGYAYFILTSALFIVVTKAISLSKKQRKQILPMAISVFLLIIPNILYISKISPIYPFDFTSLFFVIVGIVMLYSLYVQNFLDMVPVAYNLVIQNAQMGIIIIDNKGSIQDINPAASHIFNLNMKSSIGENVKLIMPEYKLFQQKDTNEEVFRKEINLGENNKTYEMKITPFYVHGEETGRIIEFWDITELKDLLNDLDAYAHTVAHDLKSPISQMIGLADLLSKSTSKVERNEITKYIGSAAKKMNAIIVELLKLAKIRHIDAYDAQSLELSKIVDNAILRVENSGISKEPQIILPDNWPKLNGNAIWIEEIWYNLISNAYKYGRDKVEVGWLKNELSIQFWVKDNGVGLSEYEQTQLFSKFSRAQNNEGKAEGHGLGLSIVQRIVEKQGGKVWLESKQGLGTTFFFTTPL